MISDAAIFAAKHEVEKSELELKSLSESLDRMKVRLLKDSHVNVNLKHFSRTDGVLRQEA